MDDDDPDILSTSLVTSGSSDEDETIVGEPSNYSDFFSRFASDLTSGADSSEGEEEEGLVEILVPGRRPPSG